MMDSTGHAGTLATIFPAVMGASVGKESCQSREDREGSQWRQSRSRYSRSRDSHLRRKGLCRSLTSRSCRCSGPHEGKFVSLHLFQGIITLSNVPRSTRASQSYYFNGRGSEARSGKSSSGICTKSGDFLCSKSREGEHLFSRTSSFNWGGSRNSQRAATKVSCLCANVDRECSQSWIDSTRSGYSNSILFSSDCCEWNSYFLASARWCQSCADCRRNRRSSLCSNSDARLTKGQIDLANSLQVGLAKLENSNQLTGVNV